MQHTGIRWLIFIGLAAFVPLFYYLAVVGGLLPYGGILLFSFVHLTVYGVLLYWLSGLFTRALIRLAGKYVWVATAVVLLLLAGVGTMPIFGIAHGRIQWTSAYDLYSSNRLR